MLDNGLTGFPPGKFRKLCRTSELEVNGRDSKMNVIVIDCPRQFWPHSRCDRPWLELLQSPAPDSF